MSASLSLDRPARRGRRLEAGRIEPFESLLVVVGLLVIMATFRSILFGDHDDRTAGTPIFQLTTGAIYGLGLGLLALGVPTWFLRALRRAWPLFALIALTMLSTLWSDAPASTFRRSAALLLSTSFAVYIAARFELAELLRLILIAFAIYLLIGLLSPILPGAIRRGDHAGAWQALTGHKNDFGRMLGVGITLTVLLGAMGAAWWRRLWLPVLALALGMLWLSQSRTPVLSTFAALVVTPYLCVLLDGRIGRARVGVDLRVFSILLLCASLLFFFFMVLPFVVELLGRDMTFSGRTKLWAWACGIGIHNWLLGAGYRAFWIDENTRYFFKFFAWQQTNEGKLNDFYAGPTHAHSAYVDLWLELGTVGILVFMILVLSTLVGIRRCLALGETTIGVVLTGITCFLLVYAITERSILQHSDDLWFFFSLFYIYSVKHIALAAWRFLPVRAGPPPEIAVAPGQEHRR